MARAARTVRPKKIGVIGAGIGGLVAAYELAEAGHEVTLFEQHGVTGGKIHQDLALNRPIDSGPTVMTMRWVFDDLLAKSGRSLDDLVELAPLEVLARHHWPDGACLDLYTDLERSAQAIGEFAGLQESRAFRAFMDQARAVYHRLEPIYMRGSKPGFWDMTRQLGPTGLALLTRLGPLQSLAQHLGRRFKDPRLQQLFGRYATYCGGSPWQAPATLMLIAYVEMRGVWAMTGGMQALAQALTDAFQALGGRLVLKTRVDEILQKDGRLCGLVASSDDGAGAGEPVDLDAVIFNGDIRGLRESNLLPNPTASIPVRMTQPSSLSAMTWSTLAKVDGFGLQYHNVFFQPNYSEEFSAIFGRASMPSQPTVYLCAQDRLAARAGVRQSDDLDERLFMLINAPAIPRSPEDSAYQKEIERCQQQVFSRLEAAGLRITLQGAVRVKTPADFAQRFPGSRGALYGRAPHGWMSVFHRSSSRTPIQGLYLAGGSIHPGAGVPMAALSGRLAAASLTADLASINPSRRVVISGGMSMA